MPLVFESSERRCVVFTEVRRVIAELHLNNSRVSHGVVLEARKAMQDERLVRCPSAELAKRMLVTNLLMPAR